MTISRRDLLRNASLGAGALTLSAILSQIQAQAAGVTQRVPRFVFVVEGNGLPPQHVMPLGYKFRSVKAGGGWVRERATMLNESLEGKELAESLQPIVNYQDRITLVNGLSGKISGGGHSNDFGALGAYNCGSGVGNSGAPQGETVDVAVGKQLGGIFPHFGVGISDRNTHDVIYNCSAWGVTLLALAPKNSSPAR